MKPADLTSARQSKLQYKLTRSLRVAQQVNSHPRDVDQFHKRGGAGESDALQDLASDGFVALMAAIRGIARVRADARTRLRRSASSRRASSRQQRKVQTPGPANQGREKPKSQSPGDDATQTQPLDPTRFRCAPTPPTHSGPPPRPKRLESSVETQYITTL